jgi:selenocysteine-specific elongation factor
METVGGGAVLVPGGPLMGRRAMKSPASGIASMIAEKPWGAPTREIGVIFNLPDGPLQDLLKSIPGATIFEAGGQAHIYSSSEGEKLIGNLKDKVAKFHSDNPSIVGMEELQLAKAAMPGASPAVAGWWIKKAVASGALEYAGSALRVAGRAAVFDEAADRMSKAILSEFLRGGFNPPKPEIVYESAGLKRADAAKMARSLIARGDIVNVSPDLSLHKEMFSQAVERLRQEIGSAGSITTARYRDILGTGRKVAIDLLEYFDKAGLTRRIDDKGTRVLK